MNVLQGADEPPTASVVAAAKDRLGAYDVLKRKWEGVQKAGVSSLNAKLKAAGLAEVVVKPAVKPPRGPGIDEGDDEPAFHG